MLQPEKVVLSQIGVITLMDLQEQVPVRPLNLSDKPRKIGKETPLTTCEPVLGVLQSSHEDKLAQINVSELGPLLAHVKMLFERAAINLVPYQKDALLNDYANFFPEAKILGTDRTLD